MAQWVTRIALSGDGPRGIRKVLTPNNTMSQQSAVVMEENAEIAGSLFDDDDEDMPMIKRSKFLVHQTKT